MDPRNCTKTLTPDSPLDTPPLGAAPPDCLEELLALDRLCFGPLAWSREAWQEVVSDPAWTTLVWCPDGTVRGSAVLLLAQPESVLASVAIHPAHRRQGVGLAFVQEAIRLARRAGAQWLSLEVDEDNAPAVALYRRTGFKVCRRFLEDGRPRWEMRRWLRSQAAQGGGVPAA
ncbi:MAG: GNAT family N-acetyltransferase [Thermoanaerobaculaceae bacterium]|nr:GNAT family N-acetyltransferase [Thermoanaerobaculaceae bacterium]